MNLNMLKKTNRGGDLKCVKCNRVKYMGPKYIQSIEQPICRDCSIRCETEQVKLAKQKLKQLAKEKRHEAEKEIRRKEYLLSKNKLTLDDKLSRKISSFCTPSPTFSTSDLLYKIGLEPKCYLTGLPIDLNDTKSYHLDHIIPTSRGGENTLENCNIATASANRAKSDLTVNEFRELCRLVISL